MGLFRKEVFDYQNRDRLAGEVLIDTPYSFYLTTIFFTAFLGIVALLAFNAEYPRIESLRGVILPDLGLVNIMPSRPGIVARISVEDGASVRPNDLLAVIKVDESTNDGTSATSVIASASELQRKNITAQIAAVSIGGAAKGEQLRARRVALETEVAQIKDQLALALEMVNSAAVAHENSKTLAKSGYATKQYVQASIDALTQRQLNAATLAQSASSKEAEIRLLASSIEQTQAETKAQMAGLSAAAALVDQQAVGIGLAGSYQIRSVVAGSVARVSFKVGQQVTAQNPLMTIVPSGSVLRAEFAVPSSSIGFLRTGQKVKLAIDAFPYQKFGTLEGVVANIANSAVSVVGEKGDVSLLYPVIVTLSSQRFRSGAVDVPLRPGMTLGARVVTERRTFFEWFFEPYFAVSRRD